MKKIFILAALLFFASPVFAAPWDDSDTHKCVVLNASIWEVEQTVTDLIKAYDGVVTPREMDGSRHVYTVDYNDLSLLGYWGGGENWATSRFAKATFSVSLKPLGQDVLITSRYHAYKNLPVFRHYKKVYRELKFNNKKIVSYKRYKNMSRRQYSSPIERGYRTL